MSYISGSRLPADTRRAMVSSKIQSSVNGLKSKALPYGIYFVEKLILPTRFGFFTPSQPTDSNTLFRLSDKSIHMAR